MMIKKNQKAGRQQLLRKNSDDSTIQYPPFELEDTYSEVAPIQKQSSYYCFQNATELGSNPYLAEERMSQGSEKPKSDKPQKITMNGNYYQRIDCFKKQQSVQEIKALCGACNTFQLIPKGSTKFYCYQCSTLNGCQSKAQQQKAQQKKVPVQPKALVKLFICGTCSVKVQYQPGVSPYIKCTRCSTVNYVPK